MVSDNQGITDVGVLDAVVWFMWCPWLADKDEG